MPASKDKLPKSLKMLLIKDLLETDALNQISQIIRVTEEDTKLCPYYPGAFFYFFLVNQRSSVRDVLEKHFSFYKGDLLRDSYQAACDAERDHFNWEDSGGWEINIDCMRGLAKALGVQKLNSGQIAASLLFPFNPFYNARKKRNLNWKNYNFKKFVLSEIDGGCYKWSDALIDKQLAALARDLVTYDGTFILDPHSIAHRYNLLLTEVGDYIKVSVAERWGSHIVEPKQKGIITREGLWLPHKALFMPNEVSEFESLLNATPPTPEEAFQEFFQTYPHWLFLLGDYEEHMEQVQLRLDVSFSDEPEEKRWLQPDFLLKRIGLNVWDILDIKRSNPRIVVGKDTRRRFSSAVQEAIAQVREYCNWFKDSSNREQFKKRYGISTIEPVPIVVIGRDFDFNSIYEKQHLQHHSDVRIFTYDDLHRIAKHRTILYEKL